jgi:toxin ParE1/3/4
MRRSVARLEFSSEAALDLDDIFAFGASQFGYDVAEEYHTGIEATCNRLIDHPELGAIYPGIRPPMRYLGYRRHHIFYRFDGETVLVTRILHHAMNAPTRLKRR